MRHLRWLISLIIFMVATHGAKELHGWPGFWIASVVMAAYGIINYFDGYFARQRELEEKLSELGVSAQVPPWRPLPRTP